MGVVVSFQDYQPPIRFDSLPWTEARIQEATTSTGTWATIDTITLSPVDADPSDPAFRSFTTELGTAEALWYRVIFADANGDTAAPTMAIQNAATLSEPYASSTELARILKIRSPTAEQTVAMDRVLTAAAGEINAEIDMVEDDLADWERDICTQVNLDRAADLWRHTESIPGVLGSLDETLSSTPVRYSWERYAQRLAPIKRQWGLA